MSESPAVTPATDTPDDPIVTEVLDELYGRKGFDWWWDDLDDDIQQEIRDALAGRVAAAEPHLTAALRDEVGRLRTERDEARAEASAGREIVLHVARLLGTSFQPDGLEAEVISKALTETLAEVAKLRAEVKHLTNLHDERDAIERTGVTARITAELERMAESDGQEVVSVDDIRFGTQCAFVAVHAEDIADRVTALRNEASAAALRGEA